MRSQRQDGDRPLVLASEVLCTPPSTAGLRFGCPETLPGAVTGPPQGEDSEELRAKGVGFPVKMSLAPEDTRNRTLALATANPRGEVRRAGERGHTMRSVGERGQRARAQADSPSEPRFCSQCPRKDKITPVASHVHPPRRNRSSTPPP